MASKLVLTYDDQLHLPRRITSPTSEEFVEDNRHYMRWLDKMVDLGQWTENERARMHRAMLADALQFILDHQVVEVYCGAYVGPAMQFTEMPECGTTFLVQMDDYECPSLSVPCPSCGADCEIEWPHLTNQATSDTIIDKQGS